jgi:hypothetical protein
MAVKKEIDMFEIENKLRKAMQTCMFSAITKLCKLKARPSQKKQDTNNLVITLFDPSETHEIEAN